MFEHFLTPSTLRIAAITAGILLLVLAAVADALKLLGRQTRPQTRGLIRALLALAGAGLIGWALLGLSPAAAPQTMSAPVSAPAAQPVPPADIVQQATLLIGSCPLPAAPTIPEGSSASMQQMQEAAGAFKAYDAGTLTYTHCVDASVDRVRQQYAGTASDADLQRLRVFGDSAHNTAIDQEQALADKFNAQVRLYRSRHPK
jgi:hypothetical protein